MQPGDRTGPARRVEAADSERCTAMTGDRNPLQGGAVVDDGAVLVHRDPVVAAAYDAAPSTGTDGA